MIKNGKCVNVKNVKNIATDDDEYIPFPTMPWIYHDEDHGSAVGIYKHLPSFHDLKSLWWVNNSMLNSVTQISQFPNFTSHPFLDEMGLEIWFQLVQFQLLNAKKSRCPHPSLVDLTSRNSTVEVKPPKTWDCSVGRPLSTLRHAQRRAQLCWTQMIPQLEQGAKCNFDGAPALR